jgi:hypothetical protein
MAVDGQNRYAAPYRCRRSARVPRLVIPCDDRSEPNRQFILVNNPRPISKPLTCELLPGLDGLPDRLSARAGAALVTAENDALLSGVSLVRAFFSAVQCGFEGDWKGHTPKTSRLLHGAGLISRWPWNALQNTKSDYRLVSHPVRPVRRTPARNPA